MMIGQQYYTASVTMKVENLTKVYSSALSAGLAFAPMGVLFLVISGFLSARFINRFGVKPILISGMTLQTIGYLLLSRISLTESYFGLLGPMLVIAVGTGLELQST